MKMNQEVLYSFLKRYRFGVISSTLETGTPQSALMGIAVTPQLEILFETLKSTRKYSNLRERPTCSFVVGWGGEQTVQFEGIALEPQGAELTRVQESYCAIWPECRSHLTWNDIAYFAVRPTWIRYSDFNRSPAVIREMRINE